jgi:hypothetical protein
VDPLEGHGAFQQVTNMDPAAYLRLYDFRRAGLTPNDVTEAALDHGFWNGGHSARNTVNVAVRTRAAFHRRRRGQVVPSSLRTASVIALRSPSELPHAARGCLDSLP